MKHLWTYDAVCHHCGCDGAEMNEARKQGYDMQALGGIHCPSGTAPNLHPLPEPDYMPYEREEWD